MKNICYLFFFMSAFASSQTVAAARTAYSTLNKDALATQKMYDEFSTVLDSTTVLAGYKAALMMLQAKRVKGVKNKKQLFKDGAGLLEKVISENPSNIELRTLRLSIQENAPKFLKYNKNIEEDKVLILKNFRKTKSKPICDFVRSFVLQSSVFTSQQKTLF